MPAAYDTYDYPSYWKGREYEHEAEVHALKSFLGKIDEISVIADLGAGYGRLTPVYYHRAKRITLTDSSGKVLKMARKNIGNDKVKYIQSSIENLGTKIKKNSVDVVLLIRVLHHVENLDEIFEKVKYINTKNGFLILEFANKRHLKATLKELFRGNFTFWLDIFPKEVKGNKKKKSTNLPFKNYHPDLIKQKLKNHNYEIIEERSVSNIRSGLVKKLIPKDVLIAIEKLIQRPLSHICFGPSIFILAKYNG